MCSRGFESKYGDPACCPQCSCRAKLAAQKINRMIPEQLKLFRRFADAVEQTAGATVSS
jgi:hypothetical protein